MIVCLIDPIPVAGRTLVEIELREPGRNVVLLMKQLRGPLGFNSDAVPRLTARLSSVSEATARRLSDTDRENIRGELEALYQRGCRCFAYREAVRRDNWARRTVPDACNTMPPDMGSSDDLRCSHQPKGND